jgi:glutathione synthase/RimK-type ligase-like ATP-grasp enzyme
MTQSIALITAREARDLDEDLAPLQNALAAAGAKVSVIDWDGDAVDWKRFDLALLRSTWGYDRDLSRFLEWARAVSSDTLLLNPVPLIEWNADKHYLADLRRAQVPIVPSEFLEPDDDALQRIGLAVQRGLTEFVVKPAVGAGSRDAQRYTARQFDMAVSHAKRLLSAERSVLLQPYLDRVDEDGETALMYFRGEFSHAIRKGALLRRDEGPTQGLFAPEQITPRTPDATELQIGAQALAALSFQPLYARVDLIRDSKGLPCVLELELIEPSLFFLHAQGSAERFASCILDRMTI